MIGAERGVGEIADLDARVVHQALHAAVESVNGVVLGDCRLKIFRVHNSRIADRAVSQHAEASPVTYVEQLRAPLLIIQGRNDARCPARQMEDYVARAGRLGKDVTIDWFDAGHGHGATDTKVAWCRRSIEFVESRLGLDAPPL